VDVTLPGQRGGSLTSNTEAYLVDMLRAADRQLALVSHDTLVRAYNYWKQVKFHSAEYTEARDLIAALVAALPREQLAQMSLEEIHARVLSVCALLDIRVET
jgi:hypothetical protein